MAEIPNPDYIKISLNTFRLTGCLYLWDFEIFKVYYEVYVQIFSIKHFNKWPWVLPFITHHLAEFSRYNVMLWRAMLYDLIKLGVINVNC